MKREIFIRIRKIFTIEIFIIVFVVTLFDGFLILNTLDFAIKFPIFKSNTITVTHNINISEISWRKTTRYIYFNYLNKFYYSPCYFETKNSTKDICQEFSNIKSLNKKIIIEKITFITPYSTGERAMITDGIFSINGEKFVFSTPEHKQIYFIHSMQNDLIHGMLIFFTGLLYIIGYVIIRILFY